MIPLKLTNIGWDAFIEDEDKFSSFVQRVVMLLYSPDRMNPAQLLSYVNFFINAYMVCSLTE